MSIHEIYHGRVDFNILPWFFHVYALLLPILEGDLARSAQVVC